MHISTGDKDSLGSCNFCNKQHYVVVQMNGNGVIVRFCTVCLEKLKKYKI